MWQHPPPPPTHKLDGATAVANPWRRKVGLSRLAFLAYLNSLSPSKSGQFHQLVIVATCLNAIVEILHAGRPEESRQRPRASIAGGHALRRRERALRQGGGGGEGRCAERR